MPGSSVVPALPPPDDWRDRPRRIVGRRDRRRSASLPGPEARPRGSRRDASLAEHRPRSLRYSARLNNFQDRRFNGIVHPQAPEGDATRLTIVEPAPTAAVTRNIVLCAGVAERELAPTAV